MSTNICTLKHVTYYFRVKISVHFLDQGKIPSNFLEMISGFHKKRLRRIVEDDARALTKNRILIILHNAVKHKIREYLEIFSVVFAWCKLLPILHFYLFLVAVVRYSCVELNRQMS